MLNTSNHHFLREEAKFIVTRTGQGDSGAVTFLTTKGQVIFKSGYPVGVFFKGCEIFGGKFKGFEIFPENHKGSENFPSPRRIRGAKI